jgi:cobalt/nickel transport system permease protein
MILLATTGMGGVAAGMERLGVPRVFIVQLLFLYRYLFVLAEEALRVTRARALRSFGRRGKGLKPYAALLGHLLLRTLERAERIHRAMLARGFDGEFRRLRPLRFGKADTLFVAAWGALFALFRTVNIGRHVGDLLLGLIS